MKRIDTALLDVPCYDVWPRDSLRETVMQAYKALEEKGQIAILKVLVFDREGSKKRIEIAYMSMFPKDWTKDFLKEEEARIIAAGKQEKMAI